VANAEHTAEVDPVARVLREYRTWAVVGCSPSAWRDSHDVAAFLQRNGYRVIPVNPQCDDDEILGERCYPDLASVPEPVDVVDIFRRSTEAGAHVDEAIAVGAKAVWMQLGVIDELAAARARAAGLDVVMDRCPKIELPRLLR
jgi:predicted CoA-binding protein